MSDNLRMGRILVVDDDPDILRISEQVLASAGHTVFIAPDAMKAMDYLNNVEFDLLISDANMPHYSGFELVQTIKNNPRFVRLTIAMLTGLRERKDIERAIKIGVDDYIVKPIDPMILLQKIDSLFAKKPPEQTAEIRFENSPLSVGNMYAPIQLESVSELGVTILTDMAVKPGMTLDLQIEFFKQLGVEAPPMKVLRVEAAGEQTRANLIFLGAREAFLQRIRKWMFSHNSGQPQQKSAA